MCAAYAVGASVWDRSIPRSQYREITVGRIAILGGGQDTSFPSVPSMDYRVVPVPGRDFAALHDPLQRMMREAEAVVAWTLAKEDCFVVADGPINAASPREVVGYVKSHHRMYLDGAELRMIRELRAGERTPLFSITGKYERYSWYLRLMDIPHGHSWSGIVRLEAASEVPLSDAIVIADRTAAVLPLVAMPLHLDARAPQNLAPIAALERTLRHRLGEEGLVRRALHDALNGVPA
jgi:hypothetical protein